MRGKLARDIPNLLEMSSAYGPLKGQKEGLQQGNQKTAGPNAPAKHLSKRQKSNNDNKDLRPNRHCTCHLSTALRLWVTYGQGIQQSMARRRRERKTKGAKAEENKGGKERELNSTACKPIRAADKRCNPSWDYLTSMGPSGSCWNICSNQRQTA